MVYAHSAVSFANTSVHISVEDKIHISIICHADDFYIMLLAHIPEILLFLSPETENLHNLSVFRGITPQISLLNEGCCRTAFIYYVMYVLISHSQKKSLIRNNRGFRIKYLSGRALKIKKHNTCFRIPHSVELCHIINLDGTVIRYSRNLVINRNTRRCLINIFNNRNAFLVNLRF